MKRMKFAVVILLAPTFLFVKPAFSQDHNSHYQAADELVTCVLKDTYQAISTNMIELEAKRFPPNQQAAFKAGMGEFMAKYFTWDIVRDGYAKIYMAEFTESELKDITAFYQTPAGAKLKSKSSILITMGAENTRNIISSHQPEFQEILKKYVKSVQ